MDEKISLAKAEINDLLRQFGFINWTWIWNDVHTEPEKGRIRRYMRVKVIVDDKNERAEKKENLEYIANYARTLAGVDKVKVYKPKFYHMGLTVTFTPEPIELRPIPTVSDKFEVW